MALLQRFLDVQFTLASGTFPEGGNTVTLKGLRTLAKVLKAATPVGGILNLTIFGMTLSVMSKLSTLGMVFRLIPRNTVTLLARDSGGGQPAIVFVGTVTQAWIDFGPAPEVGFHIEAQTLGNASVISMDPTSIDGSADVAGVMSNIAQKTGCTFENNGVNAQIPSPYLYGSPRSQADACAAQAGINWTMDDRVLAIWPKNGARGGDIPVISAVPGSSTGGWGYPTFTAYGILMKTIFNPTIKFGGQVQIKSTVKQAEGTWNVIKLDHSLDSLEPHGEWSTTMECFNPKYPTPIRR